MEHLGDTGPREWPAAAAEAWKDIQERHARTILVGYSMGGALALRLAVSDPPERLILVAPLWCLLDHRVRTGQSRAAPVLYPRGAARAVQAPTLILQGKADRVVRAHDTRDLARRFGGLVQLHELDGGHLLLDSTAARWAAVRDLILSFVAG